MVYFLSFSLLLIKLNQKIANFQDFEMIYSSSIYLLLKSPSLLSFRKSGWSDEVFGMNLL